MDFLRYVKSTFNVCTLFLQDFWLEQNNVEYVRPWELN